jgi:hypothetical protein
MKNAVYALFLCYFSSAAVMGLLVSKTPKAKRRSNMSFAVRVKEIALWLQDSATSRGARTTGTGL